MKQPDDTKDISNTNNSVIDQIKQLVELAKNHSSLKSFEEPIEQLKTASDQFLVNLPPSNTADVENSVYSMNSIVSELLGRLEG